MIIIIIIIVVIAFGNANTRRIVCGGGGGAIQPMIPGRVRVIPIQNIIVIVDAAVARAARVQIVYGIV